MKTITTKQSLTISENFSSISIVAKEGKIEFFQNVEGNTASSLKVLNELKNIIKNKIDKKRSYDQRFKLLSDFIVNSNANSFRSLANRLVNYGN